eukprot:3421748-Rhodomonas_salina.2
MSKRLPSAVYAPNVATDTYSGTSIRHISTRNGLQHARIRLQPLPCEIKDEKPQSPYKLYQQHAMRCSRSAEDAVPPPPVCSGSA